MKINSVYYHFKTKQISFLSQMEFLNALLNLKMVFSETAHKQCNMYTLTSKNLPQEEYISL